MIVRDQSKGRSAFHINDYKILDGWFQADTGHYKFRPREFGGFDILLPELYDEALQIMNHQIHEYELSKDNEFIIIEFARCDYQSALEQFRKDFIQSAYFLFIEADIETCVQRVLERVHKPIRTLDDHFTSEFVFECYRQNQKDYTATNTSMLQTKYNVDVRNIKVVDNRADRSFQDLYKQMNDFVEYIKSKQAVEKDTGPLILANEHALN